MRAAGRTARGAAAVMALAVGACKGGGPGNPVAPPTPPGELSSLVVTVFYDENANGQLDADELARVPNATVRVGSRTAQTEMLTGRATLTGLPGGQASLTVSGLPRFYVAPAAMTLQLPASGEVDLPVTLPIGSNLPNRYLAFGDSITDGEGSSTGEGYRPLLEDRLRAHFGAGELVVDAAPGTYSDEGAARIDRAMARFRPAYTLILYGTNDWYPCDDAASCFTIPSLATMVRSAKAASSLPVLATIPPVNVGYDDRVPPRRNEFVADQDRLIRDLAAAEGALLVDLEPAFYQAAGSDLSQLFDDHVHPNDRGYVIVADEFFKAISAPTGAASTAAFTWELPAPVLSFDPALVPGPAPDAGARRPPPHRAPRPRLRDD